MFLIWSYFAGKLAEILKLHVKGICDAVFFRGVVAMPDTLVETSKIVELLECNLETKTLLASTLLKWMDIIACLAGKST